MVAISRRAFSELKKVVRECGISHLQKLFQFAIMNLLRPWSGQPKSRRFESMGWVAWLENFDTRKSKEWESYLTC